MPDGPGRLLGLDLGSARIGLALSDELRITAQPLRVLLRTTPAADVATIRDIVRDAGVACVVVGHPRLLSGALGRGAEQAEQFARRLRGALPEVRVELWDERLTTAQAQRVMTSAGVSRRERRDRVDAVAAALILQSYMDADATARQRS